MGIPWDTAMQPHDRPSIGETGPMPDQPTHNSTVSVLVVEDDRAAREALDRALRLEGYDVSTVADGRAALEAQTHRRADVVVLDLMLPHLDGVGVATALRQRGDATPILMLTARDGVGDRVRGLDAGADDYLPKPYALDELLARLRALLRRRSADEPESSQDELEVADLRLNESARRAWRGDRELELSRTEFDLLAMLARNTEIVLGHGALYEQVWGYDYGDSNNLAVYVRYLRRKTEAHGESRLIHTVRGVGYVLSPQAR
jgi:two-component system response regulator MprA